MYINYAAVYFIKVKNPRLSIFHQEWESTVFLILFRNKEENIKTCKINDSNI